MRKILILIILLILSQFISAQTADVTGFSNTLKYNWFTPQDRYDFRENLSIRSSVINDFERQKIDVTRNMQLSMILPGTGHLHTGNYFRGILFLGSEIALASAAVHFVNEGRTNYDRYKSATRIDEINRYYDAAVTSYVQATIVAGLFVAIWIYNVFDTRNVTREYNRRLWINLQQAEQERRLQIAPNGISYHF